MENNINLTHDAAKAIQALQHPCGTFAYYANTITRLFTYVLHSSDEIGMGDMEAIGTLRALDALRADLEAIAGNKAPKAPAGDIAERPELAFNVSRNYDPVRTLLVRALGATMEASEAANDALDIVENNEEIVAHSIEDVAKAVGKINEAVDCLAKMLDAGGCNETQSAVAAE